jgi:hypothetical protein
VRIASRRLRQSTENGPNIYDIFGGAAQHGSSSINLTERKFS